MLNIDVLCDGVGLCLCFGLRLLMREHMHDTNKAGDADRMGGVFK